MPSNVIFKLDQIHKLVSQAGPNDHLVFYCMSSRVQGRYIDLILDLVAGHCYQLVSHDANELDGYDEGACLSVRLSCFLTCVLFQPSSHVIILANLSTNLEILWIQNI